MARAHKKVDDQELREQEVLRANRELAAYFKGQRTEREARAALKIIKAFIKDRERTDAASRRPLPGTPAPAAKSDRKKTVTPIKKVRRRSVRRPVPVSVPAAALSEDDTRVEESSLDRGA